VYRNWRACHAIWRCESNHRLHGPRWQHSEVRHCRFRKLAVPLAIYFTARLKQQRIWQDVKRVKTVVADFKALTVQSLQELGTTQSYVRIRTGCGLHMKHATVTALHFSFLYYDRRGFYAIQFQTHLQVITHPVDVALSLTETQTLPKISSASGNPLRKSAIHHSVQLPIHRYYKSRRLIVYVH
jgi:hypothetical protein